MSNPTPFADSLATFTAASPWLTDEHEPELVALRFLAATLDGGTVANPAPLVAQWGLILRGLKKQAPVDPDGDDELEKALRGTE